jgi:hypothetical protein
VARLPRLRAFRSAPHLETRVTDTLAPVTRRPISLKGEWATMYDDTLKALLERYAKRGPQYELLCDLAAGLYVQVRRMEASGAIRGLESLDDIIARQLDEGADLETVARQAQTELARAEKAVTLYLQAIEAVRRLVEQAQKYTEARKQQIVVSEVNAAVVETLRIVETHVDPATFLRILAQVKSAMNGEAG